MKDYDGPYYIVKNFAFVPNASDCLVMIHNATGSGLILRVISLQIQNVKLAGYAGALWDLTIARGTYNTGGSALGNLAMDTDKPMTAYGSNIILMGGACTFTGTINAMKGIKLHSASLEQAAAAASASLSRGNLMPPDPEGNFLIRPGKSFMAYAAVADANGLYYGECLFQVMTEDGDMVSTKLDDIKDSLDALATIVDGYMHSSEEMTWEHPSAGKVTITRHGPPIPA